GPPAPSRKAGRGCPGPGAGQVGNSHGGAWRPGNGCEGNVRPDTGRSLWGAGSFPYTPSMKIYTRTGDDGTTGLLGPGRVGKREPRVEAYGAVDELNASLGAARALDTSRWLESELSTIQSRLFNLGAELATVEPDALARLERVSEEDVFALENWIDTRELDL